MLGFYVLVMSAAASLLVGTLVVVRGVRDVISVMYALLTAFLLALSVANYLAVESTTNQLFYVRSVMFSSTVAVYLLYLLVLYLRQERHQKPIYKTTLFYSVIFMALFDYSPFLFSGVVPGIPPRPIANFGIVLFFVYFIFIAGAAIWRLFLNYRSSRSQHERQQSLILAVGVIPVIVLAPLTSFILPNFFGINQFVVATPLYVLIFVLCVGYAIIRHGLFDVKRATVRGFAYILSLATLAVVYYGIAYGVSMLFLTSRDIATYVNPVSVVLALVLAFVFQPIKKFFDRMTDAIFYRSSYRADEFIARITKQLSGMTDIMTLLHYSSQEITHTLKANFGAFYIYRTDSSSLFTSTDSRAKLPQEDIKTLEHFVTTHNLQVFATAELEDTRRDYVVLHRLLISHQVAITVAIRQEEKIIGYFFLGDHLGSRYSDGDIKVLRTIADELGIAIENALSVQEVRDVNEHLQQRIDNATKELRRTNEQLVRLDEVKDEFMSMASHQLRTPLTTIKGYISMVMEGDAGAITPAQKHLLSEAFDSSERMVRLIADFLNVSRLQTGKFVIEKIPTNLAKVVEQEIDELTLNATARGIKFVYKKPKAFPVLNLDETKIRQVIMNFADNAMYYSSEGTTVTISLKTTHTDVVFTVEDEGIGVPKDQQDELFQKFFRATNARTKRPDGTGVGLFLAKKVIDGHGGSIIFKSTEGKGSTFGFRLPLTKLKVDEV